jgi:hypothetical protein
MICHTCKQNKEESSFPKRAKSKTGYDLRCKNCHTDCYKRNKKKREAYRIRYESENKESITKRRQEYTKSHKNEKANYDLKYRADNKDKIRQYKKDWESKNKNHPIFKIKRNLRRRIHHVIKDNYKSDHTLNLLGCPVEEFKSYLESKFQPGMNWDNYGLGYNKWHIDHVRPCCDFDLSKPEEQRICFHYTNMQPLWEKENLKKSYIYRGKNCRLSS